MAWAVGGQMMLEAGEEATRGRVVVRSLVVLRGAPVTARVGRQIVLVRWAGAVARRQGATPGRARTSSALAGSKNSRPTCHAALARLQPSRAIASFSRRCASPIRVSAGLP